MKNLIFVSILLLLISTTVSSQQGWFTNFQNADLMLSGVDFNNTGGALSFNHPSGIASDGTRFLLCDRFNNRILIWNSLPIKWNDLPDLVLGQRNFTSNNPDTTKGGLNFPGNVSIALNGKVVVADSYNDRILIWNDFPTQNGQAANVLISLPQISPFSDRYEWPWGVWTDGNKLIATATRGGAILFWNTMPTYDNQPPSYSIKLPQFGTLRNISTDGSSFLFVSDHNAKISGNRSGTFFWNSFPTVENQPYDFFRDEWIKGIKLPNGKLVAGGASSIYIWNEMPTSAAQNPNLTLRNNYYKNGDGPDIVYAEGRLYVNNYNGNNIQVYNSFPTTSMQLPDWALGSPLININTLDSINYIQNPVLATDGLRLIVSSDFDRVLWIWNSLPTHSGKAPDKKISLASIDLSPWDNALYNGKLILAGKNKVAIWESLPLNNEPPSKIFTGSIGSANFVELKGVALDSQYLYLADANGSIYVWQGVPTSNFQNPFRVISAPSFPLNHLNSDGTYLCVSVQGNPASVLVYKVSDIATSIDIKPFKIITSIPGMALNLPASAITFSGSLAIANTSNNSVFLWKNINDAGDTSKLIVLGQPNKTGNKPAIGINRLFMPASLLAVNNSLWVGEVKFSSRILKFSYQTSTKLNDEGVNTNRFELYQNYPNPFNPVTTITFSVPIDKYVTLSLFNTLGQKVRVLFEGEAKAGKTVIDFKANELPSGVYYYQIKSGELQTSKKMILMK